MSLKIAAISDDLSSQFDQAARIAVDLGLTGLALRHLDGVSVRDLTSVQVREVRAIADDHGLEISAVSSPLGREIRPGADMTGSLAVLDRMIEFAGILGTPLIRIFAPWLEGQDPVSEWARRPDLAAVLPVLADQIGALAERAEASGVTLMLELEGASHIGTVDEARQLLTLLESPALALCWDVCNGWWSGEDPVGVGLKHAAELPVVDVQLKDVCARADDPARADVTQVVLGDGAIDYPAIVATLLTRRYQGWWTAERVHHPRRPEREPELQRATIDDLRRLKEMLTR